MRNRRLPGLLLIGSVGFVLAVNVLYYDGWRRGQAGAVASSSRDAASGVAASLTAYPEPAPTLAPPAPPLRR